MNVWDGNNKKRLYQVTYIFAETLLVKIQTCHKKRSIYQLLFLWSKFISYCFAVLFQYSKYPTSIAALSFNKDGRLLAVASSYTFEGGDKPYDLIHLFLFIGSFSFGTIYFQVHEHLCVVFFACAVMNQTPSLSVTYMKLKLSRNQKCTLHLSNS